MKLYINAVSPYARLTDIVCRETGLREHVDYVAVNPWQADPNFTRVSESGKVPALQLTDGRVLLESDCICQYFMQIADQPHDLTLVASERPTAAHADVVTRMQMQGLARAALDCAFSVVVQKRFAADAGGGVLVDRWSAATRNLVDALSAVVGTTPLSRTLDMADITTVVALDYIDFRLPELAWAAANPTLKTWLDHSDGYTSLVQTRPAE